MGKFKELLAGYVEKAKEAMECYPDERIEVSYLDAVESAGETPDWVINCGSMIIADNIETEFEAECLLEVILDELNLEEGDSELPEVNDNGSLLNPDTITYCSICLKDVHEHVDVCPSCGSADVEHIQS